MWLGGNGSRYVVPVAPFLFLFFYFGLCRLLRQIVVRLFQRKGGKPVSVRWAYLLLLIAFPMLSPLSIQAKEARQPFPPAYRCYFELAKAMERQLPAGAVVSCRKPELFAYFAPSHFPVRYLFSTDPDEGVADMVRRKVDYVILEQLGYSSTPLYLYPALQKYPELFPVISHISSPDTYLLGFDRGAALRKFSAETK